MIAIQKEETSKDSMDATMSLLIAWRWPAAVIISTLVASRAVLAVTRNGIRVEIFTRQPILVGTGRAPLRAEVGKVRI